MNTFILFTVPCSIKKEYPFGYSFFAKYPSFLFLFYMI